MKKLTAREAVLIGKRAVNYPIIGLFAFFVLIGSRIMEVAGLGIIWFFIGLACVLVLMWLYWSLAAPRWLAWAYQRVDNKAELRERAEEAKLIWSDGHIFNKTMIVFPKDKAIIEEGNQTIDDGVDIELEIDKTLNVYINPYNVVFMLPLYLGLNILTFYVLFTNIYPPDWSALGLSALMICIVTLPFFFKMPIIDNREPMLKIYRMFFTKEPILEIFEKGVSIKYTRTGLIEWKNVKWYSLERTDLQNVKSFTLHYTNEEEEDLEVDVNFEYSTFDAFTLESTMDFYINKNQEYDEYIR